MVDSVIRWPRSQDEDQSPVTEWLRQQGEELIVPERDEAWVDELIANWPEEFTHFSHPADWRPSVREAQLKAISSILPHLSEEGAIDRALFFMQAVNYKEWLRKHMIIEAAAASMVAEVLLHPDKGGDRNLRHIAVTDEHPHDVARRFEQDYLRLEPLDYDDDEDSYFDYADLRIHEDGLYGPWDFEFGERHGGLLPIAALAKVLKTTPKELNQRLTSDEINKRNETGHLVTPWNMIRTDQYLLPVRPHAEDPGQLIVGPVRELTTFGSYLLEEFLRAYELGNAMAK